jgi:hypothetical protein
MHGQDVATGAVEPGEHDNLVAGAQVAEARGEPLLEHEPRVGRTLVSLSRCAGRIREWRLDTADRGELVAARLAPIVLRRRHGVSVNNRASVWPPVSWRYAVLSAIAAIG